MKKYGITTEEKLSDIPKELIPKEVTKLLQQI